MICLIWYNYRKCISYQRDWMISWIERIERNALHQCASHMDWQSGLASRWQLLKLPSEEKKIDRSSLLRMLSTRCWIWDQGRILATQLLESFQVVLRKDSQVWLIMLVLPFGHAFFVESLPWISWTWTVLKRGNVAIATCHLHLHPCKRRIITP